MSLTKKFLLEVSDAKKEALYKLYLKKRNITPDILYEVEFLKRVFETEILSLDPTPNNQYTQWLLMKGLDDYLIRMSKNWTPPWSDDDLWREHKEPVYTYHRLEEDGDRIEEALMNHFNFKQRANFPREYKDINNVKDIRHLYDILEPFLIKYDTMSNEEILKSGVIEEGEDYETIYSDSQTVIFQPITEKGACLLGTHSEWCTSWGRLSPRQDKKSKTNQFDYYKEDGVYIIWNKQKDTIYQMHFESGQYMDYKDNNIGFEEIYDTMSNGAKIKIADLAMESLLAYVKVGDRKYAKFDNLTEFAEKVIPNADFELSYYLDEENMNYFGSYDSRDMDIASYTKWSDQVVEKIKELIKEYYEKNNETYADYIDVESVYYISPDDLDTATNDDILDFVVHEDVLQDIHDTLQNAMSQAQEEADHNEGYNTIMKEVGKRWGIDYEELTKEIIWNDKHILVPITKEDGSLYVGALSIMIKTDENDNSKPFYQPSYGYSGSIDWDYCNEDALQRLSEVDL